MNNKKIIAFVLAAVTVVSMFVGCSKNTKDSDEKTNASSEFTQAVTDENGEVVTDKNGDVVTEKIEGETVTDKNGKTVTEAVTDKNGEVVTNSNGKAVTQAVTKENSSGTSSKKSSSSGKSSDNKSKSDNKNKSDKKGSSNITSKPKAPSVPSSLKTSDVKQTSLKLSWKAVKCSGYQIAFSSDNGANWKTLEKKYTSTSYKASKLTSYTDYQFRVRAYNKNDYGTSYSDWTIVTVKTKADSDNSRQISISVKLPDSGGEDKLDIYINNKLVKSQDVTLDGSSYKYKTDKKYKGVVTVRAELESLGNARSVKTDKNTCYLSVDGSSIIVVDGEDD